jgi:3D-(3,5/4)-trihydroxycyclohexane-1,2-dione acylhydrolase (decyclizing)
LQDFTTGSWSVFKNPDVRFISINTARWDAYKQQAHPVIGDARAGLEAIDARLGAYRAPDGWLGIAQERIAEWHSYLDSWKEQDASPPAYAQVIQVINEACDDDDYILSAAGGLPGELAMGWRSKSVGSFDAEYGYSTMGYEIAGAWGAKMARGSGDVIAWVGDGSYLIMNSDIYSTVFTGHKVIFIVCDNGGFAVINRLQVNTGGAEFNNLLRTARHERYFQVDFVKHAESMGARAEKVEKLAELPAAFARAKESDRSYVLVIDVDEYTWTEGGAWWEVGIPEVSDREQVRVARAIDRTLAAGDAPDTLVLKRGPHGASVVTPDGSIDVPGFPVDVVNTVGAGDAFASGLITKRLQGWDWFEAVRFANACGAIEVTRQGCASALPTEAEVVKFINQKSAE